MPMLRVPADDDADRDLGSTETFAVGVSFVGTGRLLGSSPPAFGNGNRAGTHTVPYPEIPKRVAERRGATTERSESSNAPGSRRPVTLLIALLALLPLGCAKLPKNDLSDALLPSNFRDWSPEFGTLPTAEFDGDRVVVRNVRNSQYVTETDFVLEYETREYELSRLQTVDFFVVPFQGAEFIAHTMLSFGFDDGRYLAVSAEVRTEKGETYSALGGLSRQLELTYVVADERDLVRLRTHHRDADVYLYRTTAPPEKARELFVDVMRRVNQLAEKPEFYDTIRNNCTTNIVEHVNRIAPRRVPFSIGVLLPGYSDRDAYELGLLDRSVPFEQLRARSRINDLSDLYYDDPDFSRRIRRRMEEPGLVPTTPPDTSLASRAALRRRIESAPASEAMSAGESVPSVASRLSGASRGGADRRASEASRPISRAARWFDPSTWSIRDSGRR